MLSLANDLVARAARYVTGGLEEQRLWAVSVRGRVIGSLVCDAGDWRLSWFDGADRRLADYAGRIDGDLDGLAAALSRRVGQPVQFEQLVG